MGKRNLRFKLYFLELLGYIILFSFCVMAQNYNSPEISKADTSKSDTSQVKKDTLGYNNINITGNNFYALNENIGNEYLQDSSMTDTSSTDTSRKKQDAPGYNKNEMYLLSFNANSGSILQDSSMTDTSKTDTSRKKTDSLGYKEVKSPDYNYAFEGNIRSNYYFQSDSSATDTSKKDTTKSDTLGDNNNRKGSYYASNNSMGNSASSLNTKYLINPIKDLTQNLKLNVYLMDAQTDKVQEILREYEVKTYQSNGNHNELYEAAVNAQKDIADILTARQKKEWENSKNEWWASVNKALNLSSISKDKNNLE